jgi:peptide deformylase
MTWVYLSFLPLEGNEPLSREEIMTEMTQNQNIQDLKVVTIGEPVLRTTARLLSREEILSPEMQAFIQRMKEAMRAAPGVGLAAPQVGVPIQLIVIEDKAEYHSYLTPQQRLERERTEVPFHVVINPTLELEGQEAEFFEGCLSIPDLIGIVPRAKAVRVECLNEKAEPVVIRATGWYARILQHEIDHLRGTLFIDRAKLRTLTTMDNHTRLWKEKSIEETQRILCTP